jgi:hypothetical protein
MLFCDGVAEFTEDQEVAPFAIVVLANVCSLRRISQ